MDKYESLIISDDSLFANAFEALNVLRQSGELCDIIIRTDDGIETVAHRVVLAACSPYFRAMFTTNFIESKQPIIELKGVAGKALCNIIDYFYTSKLYVNFLNVEEIIVLAHVLQVEDMIEKCEVFLRRNISSSNFRSLLSKPV